MLAALVDSTTGGDAPRAEGPSRTAVCQAARQAADDIAARYPETPRESLETVAERLCRRGPVAAPTTEAPAAAPSPGCHVLRGAERRHPKRVRAAAPPRPVPFFAERSGRLPRTGAPRVAGVQLPAGSRCGPFWSTDAGVPDGLELARRLAAAFPSTGLWPVLWGAADEPDAYVRGGGDLAKVDALRAETVLERAWRANGLAETDPFPGLAAAGRAAERRAVAPFGGVLEASMTALPPGGPLLMLVPVNRPADVVAVLGSETTEYFSDEALSAVLRSWEERFGAVVAAAGPGTLDLVVGAPPRDLRRLVAEHVTLAPDSWPEEDLRRLLRSPRGMRGATSARYWALGWPD